jgi:hypothetical protein
MKRELLELIKEIPTIEGKFRIFEPSAGMCIPSGEFIYDNPDFIEWKEAVEYELQQIYDRTRDTYIWNIINATGVIHKFNGKNYDERKNFNRLKSSLKVIEKNIDKYFPDEKSIESEATKAMKPKIFISHSSKDVKYVEPIVELLADIGMTNDNLFCSSIPDYGIPLNQDIYEYLSSLFSENELYVIFVLSSNYYGSPACLNEMGAAWVLKNEYTSILLPKFEYQKIDGAVNPNKIEMKLDDNDELLKKRLGELKNIISEKFGISVPDMRWEKKRNDFINTIRNI